VIGHKVEIHLKKPPPEAQKNKPKIVDGKTYWWCSKHNSWGGHKESKCEGRGLEKKTETPETMANTPPCTTVKLSVDLTAIMEDKE